MRRFASLIAMAAVAAFFAGCAPDTPERLSAEAEAAYSAGEYGKAIAAYERLLEVSGEDAMTYANLAQCALGAQDLEYAKTCADKALTLEGEGPTAERARELSGMAAEARQDFTAAARAYRAFLTSDDTTLRTRVRSRLARLYAKQKRADSALAMLLAAYGEAPQDALTLYNLGLLCVNEPLRLRQSALDYFRLAERTLPEGTPERAKAKTWITRLESNLNRLRQVPPSPGNTRKGAEYLRKARENMDRKRWRSAEDYARQATQADPANFDAALTLGRLCTQNNHQSDALEAYEAALVLRSTSPEARYEAARLAYTMKRYGDAANFLRPLLLTQPKNLSAADLMMRILYAQQKGADARVWGEYCLALMPNATETYRKFVDSLPRD